MTAPASHANRVDTSANATCGVLDRPLQQRAIRGFNMVICCLRSPRSRLRPKGRMLAAASESMRPSPLLRVNPPPGPHSQTVS